MPRGDTVWRAAWLVVVIALVALACAGLNRSAAAFEVAEGVSLIFPAAALSALAGVLLGWWGAAAVFLGFLIAPWGLANTPARVVYFALAGAAQAAVPAMAPLRAEGSTARRVLRVLLYAALLNTFASALLGVPAVILLASPHAPWQHVALVSVSWFLGDACTVFLLALPVLVLLRPALLLDPAEVAMLHGWARRWQDQVLLAGVVGAVVLAMELLVPRGGVSIHWLAAFFLVAVLVAAVRGGVGAGLLSSALVSVAYIFEVLRLVQPPGRTVLFREVFSSYLNLVIFAGAAVVAGLYSARSRGLLAELSEHRWMLQESFERVVTALAAAIEAKDRSTQGHVQRVAKLAVAVGKRLGIEGRRLELLRYAAILHDVGKIGVPEQILNKDGPLGTAERRLMEAHVEIGVEILASVDILLPAIPFIRYHQERWDGRTEGVLYRGYFGLKGEEIPLEARIIAAVDAYDAMISDRPYRGGVTRSQALDELKREAGAQFDPSVVDVLVTLIESQAWDMSSDRWPVLGEELPEGVA